MKRFFDLHSHSRSVDKDVLTIQNLHDNFDQADHINPCSIGLHPWYLTPSFQEMDMLAHYAAHDHVLAIGECGLDTLCDTPWPLQMDGFQRQIELANHVQKPLIIHCVRAFAKTVKMLQNAHVPVIFHGFQKNPALAAELLQRGYYLSFGSALTKGQKNAIDSLSGIPADRFFLETDNSGTSIQEIYHAAAAIRQISLDTLIQQIHHNYAAVFKRQNG